MLVKHKSDVVNTKSPYSLFLNWARFIRRFGVRVIRSLRRVFTVIVKQPLLVQIEVVVILILAGLIFQNYQAVSALRAAQRLDAGGKYTEAKSKLGTINHWLVFPDIAKGITVEEQHNKDLITTERKLQEVQQLLKQHKTQDALKLLGSIGKQSSGSQSSLQKQVASLQHAAQTQSKAPAGGGSTSAGSGSSGGGTSTGGGTSGNPNPGSGGGTPPPAFNGNLSSCPGALTQAGSYTLSSNLTQTTPSAACISVSGLSGVSIDCQNHSIIVAAGPVPISLYGASNFTVKNCTLSLPIGVLNSSGGTIAGNTFSFASGSGQAISLNASSGITFSNNTVTNGALILKQGSTSNTITLNTINADPTVSTVGLSGLVEVDDSSGNGITNNHLNGGWHGTPGQGPGSDDGVMLLNSQSSNVSYNTISNVFDCGIESIAQATSDQLIGNTISNAGVCGIGSFYWTSWLNNVVTNNTASATQILFQLFLDNNYPLSSGQKPSTFYFQGNQFASNTFSASTPSNSNSTNMNFGSQFLPAGISVVSGNNQFKNNNFGKFDVGPNLQPQSAIVDLGGNQCAAIPAADPPSLTCN